ncbi:hypothetical protein FRC09_004468 [Ceratobasidium sp. 395]|nr:hypothetical protein FRC09_004468 [Ceratobasidium sp. 395]
MRFDFYAPHVKSLDICGTKGEMIEVIGWKVLIARAQRQALLPNLHTLTITSLLYSTAPDQPMWIGTFSCPSLVNLSITASNLLDVPTVSYPAAAFIMRSLAARCPQLERLSLFPDVVKGHHLDDAESGLLAFLSGDKFFYEHAATLTCLRHLSCTYAWFQPLGLQILGRLPYLESITACGADTEDRDYLNPTMNEDLFPMLHYLYLHDVDCFESAKVMGTTQMVKNLASLRVCLAMSDFAGMEDESWLVDRFFPLLLNAPDLTDLTINANLGHDGDYCYRMDGSMLRILQRLPLKSLHLGEIRLNAQALSLDLALVWPLVTSLKMPCQPASLGAISRFAQLPNLLQLELNLDLCKPTLEYSKSTSRLTVLEASPGSTICSSFGDIDQIARALLDIFPNITRVAWANVEENAPSKKLACERAEFLNDYFATLREFQTYKQAHQS